ncbi:MAG: phage holin family protein [Gammaproteobacteria bacterium]|uniref:Putative superfamily III holin-X n=1 Tax=Marinirhabdus gelatinilytica TaxID=1703343 RepID=A0A370QJF8_9FLAO|nr:phage holin family protein [Marinirhabdus gelatinilytica]MCK5903716.1 phage holin family protein [Gammaproteobacteria bacterium]RDK88482.1 putative superfamily III holin-X [Marinirhabdus gelatinilytica]
MAFETLSQHLNDSGKKVQEYLKNSADYYKLRLFKHAMKLSTSLINMLALGGIFMLFLMFFSFGIAMWLGRILESMLFGFFIVGGFYLVVFLLLLFFGKKHIDKAILSKFSELVTEDMEEEKHMFEDDVSLEEFNETKLP